MPDTPVPGLEDSPAFLAHRINNVAAACKRRDREQTAATARLDKRVDEVEEEVRAMHDVQLVTVGPDGKNGALSVLTGRVVDLETNQEAQRSFILKLALGVIVAAMSGGMGGVLLSRMIGG
jgi:hypothetical protein